MNIYIDENTIQKIVDKFLEVKCAMVIGSYKLTDFELNDIPPGIIDHKEWTPDNGRNNALRINGLGAPRAFFTPVLRDIKIPNVSYGEDYAVGLAISRKYQIGRIFEPLGSSGNGFSIRSRICPHPRELQSSLFHLQYQQAPVRLRCSWKNPPLLDVE